MYSVISSPLIFLCYSFLFLSVIFLWVPNKIRTPNWSIALVIAIALGIWSLQLDFLALVPITLFAFSTYCYYEKQYLSIIRVIAGLLVLVLAVSLGAHRLPGFHNLRVLDNVVIGDNSMPFSMYLNFDKTLIGIFILGLGFPLITKKREWIKLFKQLAIYIPIIVVILIIAALSLKFVTFDFKLSNYFFIWAITNLLFVCVAEEAFFRGFIQKNLSFVMRRVLYGDYVAIVITAILFGLIHFPGGVKYICLATLAGIGYGWVYYKTKKIEGSILTHFSLNLVHFIFFTYPALITIT
jgi:uncharacterized protein